MIQGMENFINKAFLHIEVIGLHVAEGHYDLVGPNGDIILPEAWESIIEPDWSVTMHMWPIPENSETEKDENTPPLDAIRKEEPQSTTRNIWQHLPKWSSLGF
jgi:hypothetical protein